jgi:hypothetical protein
LVLVRFSNIGTGILLAVTIIYEYFEDNKKENNKNKLTGVKAGE